MLFQTHRLSVHYVALNESAWLYAFFYYVFITFCPLFPNYVLLSPLNPENVNTHASIVYLNLSDKMKEVFLAVTELCRRAGKGPQCSDC